MDQVFGTLALIVISLMLSIYVGWVWKPESAVKEIEEGCPWFSKPLVGGIAPSQVWSFFIKYICPIVISLVLLNTLGIFSKKDPAPAEPTPKEQTSPEDNASSESQ